MLPAECHSGCLRLILPLAPAVPGASAECTGTGKTWSDVLLLSPWASATPAGVSVGGRSLSCRVQLEAPPGLEDTHQHSTASGTRASGSLPMATGSAARALADCQRHCHPGPWHWQCTAECGTALGTGQPGREPLTVTARPLASGTHWH